MDKSCAGFVVRLIVAYVDLSLPEFETLFSSDDACLQAIYEAHWPNGYICHQCGNNDGYRLTKRRIIQCAACRRQTSITSGTVFNKRHVSLRLWFLIVYLIAKDSSGASALLLAKQPGISYSTVRFISRKIRKAMATRQDGFTLASYAGLDAAFFGEAVTHLVAV